MMIFRSDSASRSINSSIVVFASKLFGKKVYLGHTETILTG